MSSTETERGDNVASSYVEVQQSAEFVELRRRFRRFVFPMTALFLAWYFLYVLLSAYAHDFMATSCSATSTSAWSSACCQFVSTFVITIALRPLGRPQVRPDRRAPARPDRRRRRMSEPPDEALLPAADTVGNPAVNIAIFAVFVVVTLAHRLPGLAQQHAPPPTTTPAAARSPGRRTASPSPATTCRRASFLGIAGAIAINGYDGFLYSIGFLVAWLVALLLVAELLRNTGRFTMADVLSLPAAAAAGPDGGRDLHAGGLACSTCWPRWPAPAGWWPCCSASTARRGQSVVIAVVGVLMIIYVLVGGMKGTTWVQIIKAALLIIGAAHDDGLGAGQVRLQPVRRCSATRSTRPRPPARSCSSPGLQYGKTGTTKLDFISLGAGPGARHRRPAARADALLHRARRPRRPGAVGRCGRSG